LSALHQFPSNQISGKILNREISSEEYVSSIIERIKGIDSRINSFITTSFDKSISKAREIDCKLKSKEKVGKLAGFVIGIKDNISVAGLKTTCASRMLQQYISPYDATVIERLEKEDAIIIGKLNMDEFGMGTSSEFSRYGPVHNPWNFDYVAGGSSGGSAAAVAAMQVPVSLGSDTGGSIRCPSSFCSVIGLKPTYGTVSRYGLVSYSNSLEQIGPIARTIDDIVPLLNTISGEDVHDNTTVNSRNSFRLPDANEIPDKKYRIGVINDLLFTSEKQIIETISNKLDLLKEFDFFVGEASLKYYDFALAAYYIIATAEASSNLSRFDNVRYGFESNPEGYEWNSYFSQMRSNFGEEVKRRILVGSFVLSSGYYGKYYAKAQKVRSIIKKEFARLFKIFDVLVLPTMPILPFKIGEKTSRPIELYNLDIYTILANLSGLPAISIPAGFSKNGLPIGMQLLANEFEEQKLIDLAAFFEKNDNSMRVHPDI
jgi:aspartyl-tRNA(Asn)/glutamyl-tRNA(Gln) amidotransferase subunit A